MPDDQKPDQRPFITAAEAVGMNLDSGAPRTEGLSQSPGLEEVPDSQVPAGPGGTLISHFRGPQQSAVDPVAAGLDTAHNPLTRAENRVITQTGELAAGPRPTTYGVNVVPQSAPADHSLVQAPSDRASAAVPGPSGASAPAAAIAPEVVTKAAASPPPVAPSTAPPPAAAPAAPVTPAAKPA